jgi:RNA polymerase sigma-70 factor (ECF subfamily)
MHMAGMVKKLLVDVMQATPEPDGADVAALAWRARAGDRAAYGELFERYWAGVRTVLLGWLRDEAEADDVAQDVFLHGLRKLAQLRDVRCFGGWLKQIAVRRALNRLSRRRAVACLSGLEQLPASGPGPLAMALREELRRQVRRGLKRLRPLYRVVVEKHYMQGLSLQEISDQLHTPLGTVKRRLHTARVQLREYFESGSGRTTCPA